MNDLLSPAAGASTRFPEGASRHDGGGVTSGRLSVALAALPWSRADRPSPAIAALLAYVRRHRAGVHLKGHYDFLSVADAVGRERYHLIAEDCYLMGELLYAPLLYPERVHAVRDEFTKWVKSKRGCEGMGELSGEELFELIQTTLHDHLDRLAAELATFDVVGLTTCFGQLFGNIALAQRLKRIAPHVAVVLGGSTISSRVGPSILEEYSAIDFIIQGEGERPFVALLDAVAAGTSQHLQAAGILSRGRSGQEEGGELSEVVSLDDLPTPDYEEFAQVAEHFAFDWTLAIEGSRGCWWDRARRTGNPKDTCYFCNQNLQWSGYREKSATKIVAEIRELSERYSNLRLFFPDNIVRHKDVVELASAIRGLGKEFEIFHEMRANIRPFELLSMWEAGVEKVLFGIEGLSTSYLKRIGKGTSAIQNLQAMRLCTELEIDNESNLITDFPGATDEEVRETRETILDFALSFEPLQICPFFLGIDSTVDRLREQFGVTNVRNCDDMKPGLPEDVWRRLKLFGLSFDVAGRVADWAAVRDAVTGWATLHSRRPKGLLIYRDGGSFLIVEDRRFEDFRQGRFTREERDLYLDCTEIRTFDDLSRRHQKLGLGDVRLREILNRFVAYKIMYTEDDKYLSLAVASQPRIAAQRIRAMHGKPIDAPTPRSDFVAVEAARA